MTSPFFFIFDLIGDFSIRMHILTLERAGFQVQLSEERTKRANEVPKIKIRFKIQMSYPNK